MDDLQSVDFSSVYFIGIGGIGMSALARHLAGRGVRVSGYDRTPSALTVELEREGMRVVYEDDAALLPDDLDLVVTTPAIPRDHRLLRACRARGLPVTKRAALLGALTRGRFTIGVAGSHGKTTTSSMLAHLLKQSAVDCTAFLGGITANYGTNYLEGAGEVVVVEADEFDRSFLSLSPRMAILTATDVDHLDVYGTRGRMLEAYARYLECLEPGGRLFARHGLDVLERVEVPGLSTYACVSATGEERGRGGGRRCHFAARNVVMVNHRSYFDLESPSGDIDDLTLGVPGHHNVENAVAAIAAAQALGLDAATIREGLASFRGVARRFEFVAATDDFVFIDDYAHHPAELRALLGAVRALYPHRRVTLVFQPHLYTRTRDLADDFARALAGCDELIVLDIYPAREAPIPGVDARALLARVPLEDRRYCPREALVDELCRHRPEVLVTAGAGDIGTLVPAIAQALAPTLH